MTEYKPLRVGITGVGKMGQNHLRILSMLKSVDLLFIHDVDAKRVGEVSVRYGVKGVTELEPALKDIDALFIVTPTSTHQAVLDVASRYVRNIFIEKPLTDSRASSEAAVATLLERGVNVQIGFIERFNPTVIELKKVIEHGGDVVNVDLIRTNKLSNRIVDVDVITDLMIHDIDLALYINGPARDVYAYGTVDDGMISFATAVITHHNGRFSKLTASRITEKRIRQICVTCREMFIDCDLLKKELLITKQTVDQSYRGVFLSSVEETIEVSNQEALLSEDMMFVQCAQRGDFTPHVVPKLQDGLAAIVVADQIQQLIRGGR